MRWLWHVNDAHSGSDAKTAWLFFPATTHHPNKVYKFNHAWIMHACVYFCLRIVWPPDVQILIFIPICPFCQEIWILYEAAVRNKLRVGPGPGPGHSWPQSPVHWTNTSSSIADYPPTIGSCVLLKGKQPCLDMHATVVNRKQGSTVVFNQCSSQNTAVHGRDWSWKAGQIVDVGICITTRALNCGKRKQVAQPVSSSCVLDVYKPTRLATCWIGLCAVSS